MRRIEINNGEAETLAGTPASPFGPPAGTSVIVPFVRRTVTAAATGSAGAVETSSAAPFIPLGHLTQAVVLRLANDAVRLQVLAPVLTPWEEEEEDWDEL